MPCKQAAQQHGQRLNQAASPDFTHFTPQHLTVTLKYAPSDPGSLRVSCLVLQGPQPSAHLDPWYVVRAVPHQCLDVYPQLGVLQLLLLSEVRKGVQLTIRSAAQDRYSRTQQLVEILRCTHNAFWTSTRGLQR